MKYKIFVIAAFAIGISLGLTAGFWIAKREKPIKYITVKKKAAPPVVRRKTVGLPTVVKTFQRPKVAIVMDDFGYNVNNIDALFRIDRPITLSILPNLRYSTQIAAQAGASGYEVILHLPLEPHSDQIREELVTINSRMNKSEVADRLGSAIASVPGLMGVSNHMGSKSTEEKDLMIAVLTDLKRRGLFFLDSLTSEKSVCGKVSKAIGGRYTRRDIFLDNSNDPDYIRRQVLEMREKAFKKGRLIALCHDRRNTVKVLSEMMGLLASDGIEFVYLSELVN